MPFQPGQSGNPGGRPRIPNVVKEMSQRHSIKAIEVLAACLDDEDSRVRVAAANSILDRAWGKPHQSISSDVNVRTIDASSEQARQMAEALIESAAGSSSDQSADLCKT